MESKLKICSFCGVPSKLFYSNPKCCTRGSCLMQYKNQKHEKKESKTGDGAGASKSGQSGGKIGNKSKRIKPISDKQAKKLKEYREVRDQYLKEHPNCARCGSNKNITLQHLAGRIGKNLTDVNNFMTLCVPCHNWATEFTNDAIEQGFAKSRLKKDGQ